MSTLRETLIVRDRRRLGATARGPAARGPAARGATVLGFTAVCLSACGLAACNLAWGLGDLEPAEATQTSGGGSEGGMGGTMNGPGGMGGSDIPNTCPVALFASSMVQVNTADPRFCIDSTEVSNEQYLAWLNTSPAVNTQPTVCQWNMTFEPGGGWPPSPQVVSKPVVFVDWCDARAFCEADGKHLCGTPEGGELVAGGINTAALDAWYSACSNEGTRAYPYGADYLGSSCNGTDFGVSGSIDVATAPTCEGGAPGLYDMSGNVWEWIDSCDSALGSTDICRNRGGHYQSTQNFLSCDAVSEIQRDFSSQSVGFRCCAEPG